MKEPKRLFADGSPFEKSLLESGRAEAPSGALEGRILAALAAAPSASAAELPGREAPSRLARFFKPRAVVLAVAAMGALGASAMLTASTSRRGPASPAPLSVALAPARTPAESAGEPVAPPEEKRSEVVVTPDSLPTVAAPQAARGSAPPSARPVGVSAVAATAALAAASTPSLEREIELLDAVKRKLGAGSAPEASRALDAYDAEFPNGVLRPEGTVLRVRTLLLQGNRAAANKLADEFLAAHPGSVHGKRMRALLAE